MSAGTGGDPVLRQWCLEMARKCHLVHIAIVKCTKKDCNCTVWARNMQVTLYPGNGAPPVVINPAICGKKTKLLLLGSNVTVPDHVEVRGGFLAAAGVFQNGLDNQLRVLHTWTEGFEYISSSCQDRNRVGGWKWTNPVIQLYAPRKCTMLCAPVVLQMFSDVVAVVLGATVTMLRPPAIVNGKTVSESANEILLGFEPGTDAVVMRLHSQLKEGKNTITERPAVFHQPSPTSITTGPDGHWSINAVRSFDFATQAGSSCGTAESELTRSFDVVTRLQRLPGASADVAPALAALFAYYRGALQYDLVGIYRFDPDTRAAGPATSALTTPVSVTVQTYVGGKRGEAVVPTCLQDSGHYSVNLAKCTVLPECQKGIISLMYVSQAPHYPNALPLIYGMDGFRMDFEAKPIYRDFGAFSMWLRVPIARSINTVITMCRGGSSAVSTPGSAAGMSYVVQPSSSIPSDDADAAGELHSLSGVCFSSHITTTAGFESNLEDEMEGIFDVEEGVDSCSEAGDDAESADADSDTDADTDNEDDDETDAHVEFGFMSEYGRSSAISPALVGTTLDFPASRPIIVIDDESDEPSPSLVDTTIDFPSSYTIVIDDSDDDDATIPELPVPLAPLMPYNPFMGDIVRQNAATANLVPCLYRITATTERLAVHFHRVKDGRLCPYNITADHGPWIVRFHCVNAYLPGQAA
jgi:hypothetical protein